MSEEEYRNFIIVQLVATLIMAYVAWSRIWKGI